MTIPSLADQILYSTARLCCIKDNAEVATGTGFFYQINLANGRFVQMIITNKHVIDGCDTIIVTCHLATPDGAPSGKFVKCGIGLGPNTTVYHPDPSIDLCGVAFTDIMNQSHTAGTPVFFSSVTRAIIPSDEDWAQFDSIEEVTMVGCPNGIFDSFNNLPLVRRGITATPMSKSYEGKSQFLIDMACFPGSSGSPVFVYNPTGYLDRKNNSYMIGASRIFLVGVLFAGPVVTNTGAIVFANPPRVEVSSMMHLGNVIRSTALLAIESIVVQKVQ